MTLPHPTVQPRPELALSVTLSPEQLVLLAERVAGLLQAACGDGFTDVAGAALFLGLPRKAVYRLVERRKLPHHRAGGRLLFDRAELRRWVEEQG